MGPVHQRIHNTLRPLLRLLRAHGDGAVGCGGRLRLILPSLDADEVRPRSLQRDVGVLEDAADLCVVRAQAQHLGALCYASLALHLDFGAPCKEVSLIQLRGVLLRLVHGSLLTGGVWCDGLSGLIGTGLPHTCAGVRANDYLGHLKGLPVSGC